MTSLFFALALSAAADPCGMVPPAWLPVSDDGSRAIQRQGDQTTYTFFRDGVQTMVLQPGFRGKVDEFGMLIPFPSPPSIRKTADQTFAHLGNTVDAPIMTVEVYEPSWEDDMVMEMSDGGGAGGRSRRPEKEAPRLRFDEVRVVSQEAVGMYEVAVLEAGSPKALQVWMEDHTFRYPDGMDTVVADYVRDRWAFVAIKAKVGSMPGVAPQPGMTTADSTLPEDSTFDGQVQGMGFRFETEEPVVPMRLAAFNEASARNLVYFVGEQPVKIAGMSASLVVRQVAGDEIAHNLAEMLPVTVVNGSLTAAELALLDGQRSPTPFNGVARELLAADLLAASTGELALPFEEYEKELLAVSERFGLRGAEVDALHHIELDHKKGRELDQALAGLDDLTLTVFDGDFDADYLVSRNVTFEPYEMAGATNQRESWSRAAPGPYVMVEQGLGWGGGGGGWWPF